MRANQEIILNIRNHDLMAIFIQWTFQCPIIKTPHIVCGNTENAKHGTFSCPFCRSVVTGEATSWAPSPPLASPSWRRQRPRSWQPSLVKFFGIKKNIYIFDRWSLFFSKSLPNWRHFVLGVWLKSCAPLQ